MKPTLRSFAASSARATGVVGAEDHDDQRAAVPGRAHHHVEAGIADEAGLHPGGAG